MDVVLTDHHTVPDELPPADAILNPKLLEEGTGQGISPAVGWCIFYALPCLRKRAFLTGRKDFWTCLRYPL